MRQLLDPKKENNDKRVEDIVKRVNHVYAWMKDNGKLTDGKFILDGFIEAYGECYGKGIARTTAREHLKKAGYNARLSLEGRIQGDFEPTMRAAYAEMRKYMW
jgi:hypothetical protein